jgi:hypothetical protein
MKIEVGKYYKTRSGKKVGPAEKIVHHASYPWDIPHGGGFYAYTAEGKSCLEYVQDDIVGEWVEEMTIDRTWSEMTPKEKGALLLAHHEGKVIEYKSVQYEGDWHESNPFWLDHLAYRVKPEGPKVEEKVFDEVYVSNSGWFTHTYARNFTGTTKGTTKGTSTVTYTDGKPTKMVWASTEV